MERLSRRTYEKFVTWIGSDKCSTITDSWYDYRLAAVASKQRNHGGRTYGKWIGYNTFYGE